MDIAETSSNGEVGGDGLELLDNGQNVLGLGVERVVVNILVVDTVLLTTGNTNLHLEPLLHGGSALQVGGGGFNVVVDGLLRQVNHVGGEEGLAVHLEVLLVGVEHAIEPRKQLLGAVVGVQDNGDAVGGGNRADVVGGSDGTGNGGGLVGVGDALAGEEGSTTLRGLQDNGRLGIAGSLESGNNGRARRHVDGGDGKLVLASVLEESKDVIADDDTGLAGENVLGTHFGCLWIVVVMELKVVDVVVSKEVVLVVVLGGRVMRAKGQAEKTRGGAAAAEV